MVIATHWVLSSSTCLLCKVFLKTCGTPYTWNTSTVDCILNISTSCTDNMQGALSREHGVSNTNRSNPINYFCTQHWCCRPQGGLSRWYDVSLFSQSIFYADRRAFNGKLWTIKGSHRLVWRTSHRISCSMHSSARKARELSEDYVLFQERKYEHLWSPTQEWISSSDPCCMESKPLDLLTSVKARKLWM